MTVLLNIWKENKIVVATKERKSKFSQYLILFHSFNWSFVLSIFSLAYMSWVLASYKGQKGTIISMALLPWDCHESYEDLGGGVRGRVSTCIALHRTASFQVLIWALGMCSHGQVT